MTFTLIKRLAVLGVLWSACSCQSVEPKPPAREAPSLNYTLLGIWPERYQAYEIANSLEDAGIRTQMSGNGPCALNVEANKIEQARAIVNEN